MERSITTMFFEIRKDREILKAKAKYKLFSIFFFKNELQVRSIKTTKNTMLQYPNEKKNLIIRKNLL